jgi:hypothetical protein
MLSLIAGALGFVSGVVGVCCCLGDVVAIPAALAALVMGFIALNQMKKTAYNNRWMAVTGLVLGVVTLLVMLAYAAWFGVMVAIGGHR